MCWPWRLAPILFDNSFESQKEEFTTVKGLEALTIAIAKMTKAMEAKAI